MLKETSFAIHPEKKQKINHSAFHDIGAVNEFTLSDSNFTFQCEHGQVMIQFYREDIVRVTMNQMGNVSTKSTVAVIQEATQVNVNVEDLEDTIELKSNLLTIKINKFPCRVSFYDIDGNAIVEEYSRGMGFKDSGEVICYKEMHEKDHFYGFGEKSGFLNKRGEKLSMWCTDAYMPHNPETETLYQAIPYFMTLRNGIAHGIYFDNTFKTTFDLKSDEDSYSFMAEGGQLDYYVLIGSSPKAVVEQYTYLTGRMPLPPKWAIGYHQSRYSYESEQEVREIANTFLEKQIPLDAMYLDIHYMDGYRVFTFDKERFPTPDKMIKDLREAGIHAVPIVDPGVKRDPEYDIYQEGVKGDHFCKYIEGNLFLGDVWPGESAFPDFTNSEARKWWGEKHTFYTDLGIEGIWNDMNEPAVFNDTKTMDLNVMHNNDGDMKTHKELHNVYGFMMGKATYDGMKQQLNGKRPFLLTRAGFSGIQRYAAVWTGDNRSFWEHLELSLPMCMNLGMSGVAFCGPDVGGFDHNSNGQLLARWTQVGAFTPYFRNHCAIGRDRQEPWSFGEKWEKIIKKYIELRYQWLPHLYSLFAQTSKNGVPLMRPLLMEYPNDENVTNLTDQFMVGDNVIIAPIMKPDTYHRVVYLPEGNWVNYWTGEVLPGGQHMMIHADIETLPIYVKQGSFIAHGSIKQSTEENETDLTIHLYAAIEGESNYTLYEDDGNTFEYADGHFFEKEISCKFNCDSILMNVENRGDFVPSWSKWKLAIHGVSKDTEIKINGVSQSTTQFNAESKTTYIELDR
jgi:alpha-glucosidase